MPLPWDKAAGFQQAVRVPAKLAGPIPPGGRGELLPPAEAADADAVALRIEDPQGRELWTYVWPRASLNNYRNLPAARQGTPAAAVAVKEDAGAVVVTAGDTTFRFDAKAGVLAGVSRGGKPFSLTNGPRLVTGNATLASFTHTQDAAGATLTATFTGDLKTVAYRVSPAGWLTVDYAYALDGKHDFFGIGFDYPEANVQGMRYLGQGPYRVWKNRLKGGTLSVWEKAYNNTVTGDATTLAAGEKFEYPEFKGYYAGVRWLQLKTTEGPITALVNQDDLFVQVLTPKFPATENLGRTGVTFPAAGLSFLHAIPPIGSKFVAANVTGPNAQQTPSQGEYRGSVSFFFGEVPAP
jgi:hypothetical protein